jgi:hypothetical protein
MSHRAALHQEGERISKNRLQDQRCCRARVKFWSGMLHRAVQLFSCYREGSYFGPGLIQAPYKVGGPRLLRASGAGQGARRAQTPRSELICSMFSHQEMRRVFDVCHGCRRCFNLCQSFPTLFDMIDNSPSGELNSVDSSDFKKVRWLGFVLFETWRLMHHLLSGCRRMYSLRHVFHQQVRPSLCIRPQPTHHTQPGAPTRRLIHSTSTFPTLFCATVLPVPGAFTSASFTSHLASFKLSVFSVKDGNLAAAQSCDGVTGSGASSGSMGDRCARLAQLLSSAVVIMCWL